MKKPSSARIAGLTRRLRRELGVDAVLSGPEAREAYAGDKWFAARVPDLVVLPRRVDEVAFIMHSASEAGCPVTPRGAGYGYVGGCVPALGGMVLSTERMNKIREIHDRDFVAVVEPAVVTGKLQRAVRKKGLFYPPDPASLDNCSIGGNIATNAGGPRCLKYGVTRNYVLGLEVVLADGTVARCGGRTHKNKTGFDLVGLFTGSEGMLGIVTEATLRLLPLPPARAVVSAGFASIHAAAAAVQRVFREGFLPSAVEIADAFTLRAAREFVRDAKVPPGDAHVLLEIDGQASSVRGEATALARLMKAAKATHVTLARDEAGCEAMWALRRKFSESLKATGLIKLNEDVVVPRGRVVDLVRFAEKLQKRSGFPIACFGHAGDGNIHVNVMVANMKDPEVAKRSEQVLDELFKHVLALGGSITGEHGVGLAKKRWWPQAVDEGVKAIHQKIKQALDPQGIINPGKFI